MINFYIPNKKNGEKIIFLVRRHWLILFLRIHFWLVAMIIPILLALLFRGTSFVFPPENEFFKALLIIFLSIYYLSILLFMLNSFVDYYLDVWLVTTERILNIEQKQIFSRVTAEHKLTKIQDVASEVHGIIATLFDYGDVHIQTAGEKERFIFKQVPHPQEIKRKISELADSKKRYLHIKNEEKSSP